MNLDELTESQSQCSFAAQYLMTRVKESGGGGDYNNNRVRRDAPVWLSQANGTEVDPHLHSLSDKLSDAAHREESSARGSSSWNSSGSGRMRGADRKSSANQSRQQVIKQVDMANSLEGTVIKQHPLPFENSLKPGVPTKVFVFGQGAVEAARIPSAQQTKRPVRQRTAESQHQRDRQSASTGDLRRHLNRELDDIQQIRESLSEEIAEAQMNVANGKYLEKIVSETDKDIEKLRFELTEMNTESSSRPVNTNTILELAVRQRKLASHKSSVQRGNTSTSGGRHSETVMGVKPSPQYHSTGKLHSKWSDPSQAPAQPKNSTQVFRPSTQPTRELIQITSQVSVHTSNHVVPTAPKASRRVQVRVVPSSKQSTRRQHYQY